MEIIVKKDEREVSGWSVQVGDRYADYLGYEECLGVLASIIISSERHPLKCIDWLRTKDEHTSLFDDTTGLDK